MRVGVGVVVGVGVHRTSCTVGVAVGVLLGVKVGKIVAAIVGDTGGPVTVNGGPDIPVTGKKIAITRMAASKQVSSIRIRVLHQM